MSYNETVSRYNYIIACDMLPRMALNPKYPVSEFLESCSSALSYYAIAIRMTMKFYPVSKELIRFLTVSAHIIEGDGVRGVISELAHEKHECNCNMVALLEYEGGGRKYYTSEYYELTDSYGLCSFSDGAHRSHGAEIKSAKHFARILECDIIESVSESPEDAE